jgi:hypothetical protein
MILNKASIGLCKPKKRKLHIKFRNNWKKYTSNDIFLPALIGDLKIKMEEIPIKKYKRVQTGPNIQFGGLKKGFVNPTYHVVTLLAVAIPATPPTNRGKSNSRIKMKYFFIC